VAVAGASASGLEPIDSSLSSLGGSSLSIDMFSAMSLPIPERVVDESKRLFRFVDKE